MSGEASLKVGDRIELEIEALAPTGLGTGRYQVQGGFFAIFVPYTTPADVVRCRVVRIFKRYAEAELIELLKPSPYRVAPFCSHYFECGSCSLMHIAYPKQLEFKANAASFVLSRSGLGAPKEIISPTDFLRYRARAEIQCRIQNGALQTGYLERRSKQIVNLKECKILVEPCERALVALPEILKQCLPDNLLSKRDFYFKTALFWKYPDDKAIAWIRLKQKHRKKMPRIFQIGEDKIEPLDESEPHFQFPSGDINLIAHPNSFTQVNWNGNRRLVEEVVEITARIKPRNTLELHCGVGNFTVHLAKLTERVVAVEAGKKEASLLKRNLDKLGINNVIAMRSTDERALEKLLKDRAKFDLLLCDPPRGGMGKAVVDRILSIAPDNIIYVSCNPITLARDLKILLKMYQPIYYKLLDLFAQTPHIETIVWLKLL